MAVLGIAGVTAALDVILQDRIADQFRRDSPLLSLLAAVPARNSALTWAVKTDTRTAGGAYAPGAAFGAGEIDAHTRLQATLPWANYRHGLEVADETVDIVAATGGAEGVDLISSEALDVSSKLGTTMGAALYAGAGSGSPHELAGAAIAIDNSDDNFAGIDTGDNTSWKSAENTIARANLSFAELRTKLFRPIIDATGRVPDICTCSGSDFDILKSLFESSADTVTQINTYARGVVSLERMGGARAISLDGVVFMEDRYNTANTIYAWQTDKVRLRYVPAAPFNQTPAEMAYLIRSLTGTMVEEQQVQTRMAAARSNFRPILVHGGKLGTSERIFLRSGNVQLQWDQRNAFSKLTLT